MQRKYPHFVVRTIRRGRVRIYGRDYEPSTQDGSPQYDGRMDGQRWAFGIYEAQYPPYLPRGMREFVALWGPESLYRCRTMEEADAWDTANTPANVFGGARGGNINWYWWHETKETT